MKILITGGAGFIGSNFIHYWLKKYPDDEIINLDKLTYCGNLANLKDIEKNKNYKFVKGDICDKKLVDELVKDIDTIIHFAAESHVDRSIQGYAHEFTQTNIIGTQVLLEAAVKHGGQRFHHISTDEVYGALPLDTQEKFNEQTQFKPNSPYSASKAASDHLVRAYWKSFNLPVTITNTSNNYGPYQYPEKLLPVAITNLLKGKKVPIYGDGLYVRDWLYVIDHCRAIDLVLAKGKIGETYCIGGMTEDISNLDLIRQILKVMNKKEKDSLEYIKDRPGHDRRYAVDWSKAKNQLGYEPKYSLKENLEKTINWYQNNQDWWQKILSGEHFKQWEEKHYKK
ncbi:MAG: dTDP-glucose 4,6-dehydratase [Patescibacteria group bacterium]|nr:dTDP-glucose 4,6-dehydratase [Patescibacteria group bacterium]